LNDDWHFIVFHGNKNEEYVNKICNKVFKPERVTLNNLNVDNLNGFELNTLLYTKTFWESIPTEVILFFQTDTIICSKHKDVINDFIKYDYVGSPLKDSGQVGGGGLSIRKKSKLIELLNNCETTRDEDRYYSTGCNDIPIYKPSFEEAKEFAIEGVTSNKSFGLHKPYKYLTEEEIKDISEWCPEITKLKDLNNI